MNEESRAEPEETQAALEEDLALRLKEKEAQADEYLNLAKRIQADFDNYKKRSQRDLETFKRFATEELISDLLLTIDDFERALDTECTVEEMRQGLQSVHDNMIKVLQARGLREVPVEGRFDPLLHDALCAAEGGEDGEILEVYQKGYFLGDRVLRHAKVKVSRCKVGE
jgi:molecular chaperone GrpE